ncbi:hypothetical protein BMS3Abin05_02547 [bacterium BMS3Abin05]|nr:hypothetical protein BMS3Abin05_02547 [bacterium BMS3Abin05]GBE27722.1 hypothetical protein BMS3Bbin03_01651 [bacterium BMS3Bbin03]HDZ12910.1 hypothetical protein [Bacteroidota bacterium]
MKKISVVAVIFILMGVLLSSAANAQFGLMNLDRKAQEGLFNGGIGLTTIEGESYFTINIRPEIAFGKWGLGLNVNLLYSTKTGHIRSKDWNEKYDYLRMIRYIRYGWKGDKFYTRVGALDAARLGHGFIMNHYTNQASYDGRKIGLALDVDMGMFGFESMTSNLARLEIIGGRGYFRPLYHSGIPILKNLAFGGTYVTDTNPDDNRNTKDAVVEYGADVELPLINWPILWAGVYADYAKIKDYGSGKSVGIGFRVKNLLGLLSLDARLERHFLGKRFVANYFDAFYQIYRYLPDGAGSGIPKVASLDAITTETKGIYGALYGRILGTIELTGSFQHLDARPKSGLLHLGADATKIIPVLALHAAYDKMGIENVKDVFTLDNRSIARVGVGYKVKPYLIVYMDYIWSFVLDEKDNLYKPQERIEPRITFNYPFSL